jgi:hypothetical protein
MSDLTLAPHDPGAPDPGAPRKLHIKTGENICYDCIYIFSRRGRLDGKIVQRLSSIEKLEKEWPFVDEVRGVLKIRSPTKLLLSCMH